jgi:hypothetical protein
MLLEFALVVTPGSAAMYFILRFIRANQTISSARTDTARAQARTEGARRAAAVAEMTAQQALAHTGEALAVARTIELVDEKVTSLTDYLVARIEGVPQPGGGRHSRAVLGGDEASAISGSGQEGMLS